MIQKLTIKNVAIIENISIDFEKGLNVLTGETGAGKSIIIDSICAILGERASRDLIRTGTEKAYVEAFFTIDNNYLIDLFEEYGIESQEDGSLILQREFYLNGKNICRINGRLVTVSVLKSFGEKLVDIHGQYDNQSLLNVQNHIELLDNFSFNKINSLKEEYLQSLKIFKNLKSQLSKFKSDPYEKERMIDILKFQIAEISEANLKLDEEELLLKQRLLLSNAEKIRLILFDLYDSLYAGENSSQSCIDILKTSIKSISGITDIDENYSLIHSKLQEISYLLEDVSETIRNSNDNIDYSPNLLNTIDERIDLITGLKRKYGNSIKIILDFCTATENKLEEITNNEALLNNLQNDLNKYNVELFELSKELHNQRKIASLILEEQIAIQLDELEIKNAFFKVQIDFNDTILEGYQNFNSNGLCNVEFLISTNKGEPLKPLSKIASGGEMSRIMLAIKSIIAKIDKIPTLIFDEIDTGISGIASQKVANKLSAISSEHQVICITHLPHIASMADIHFLIEKDVKDDLTYTHITRLTGDSLNREIARIIGGGNISDITLKHAKEMLKMGKKNIKRNE